MSGMGLSEVATAVGMAEEQQLASERDWITDSGERGAGWRQKTMSDVINSSWARRWEGGRAGRDAGKSTPAG
ncbi:hypothetical protein M0R45_035499 [Rubus argutus]|uniref:Uncharacterized protein n=1 Tax=Rubus argutus TaxID=59490 RepID=A0AAW1VXJ7_RUBAR